MPEVSAEKLKELGNQVLEFVPEEERDKYQFWRATHLGAIALNLAKGHDYINTENKEIVTFVSSYERALNRAKGMATPGSLYKNQAGLPQKLELQQHFGIKPDFAYPIAVAALDPAHNRRVRHIPMAWDGFFGLPEAGMHRGPYMPCGGDVYEGQVTLDMLDPFSRVTIKHIFGLLAVSGTKMESQENI